MLKYENGCVGCQLPCLYNSCPYYRIPVNYCDKCGDYADINLDGEDFCIPCAEKRLDSLYEQFYDEVKDNNYLKTHKWEDLAYDEKAEILGIKWREI